VGRDKGAVKKVKMSMSTATNAAVTTERNADASPRLAARLTGVVYLLHYLTAIVGQVVLQQAGISQFGVSRDAAATAHTILAHQASLRVGVALGLLSVACYVAVTALLYQLFQSVSRSLALIAVFLSLMGLAPQVVGNLLQLAPVAVLAGGPSLRAFTTQQVQALALLALHVSAQAEGIGLVFDGLFLLLIGSLIVRATFLPRVLGAVIALAGVGWLTVLWPPLAHALSPFLQILGFVAEALLMLWLLVRGVNVQRWKQQANKQSV
jgi:hypothetical protein